jgi:hypothetical protein
VLIQPQIFLNYASEDRVQVTDLYQQLLNKDYSPWMDDKQLIGGERWNNRLEREIRRSHFFIACLSKASVGKRGVIEKEREIALEIQEIFPDNVPYLIPALLEQCDVPPHLSHLQWVNLYETGGIDRLCRAIEKGVNRRLPKENTANHTIVIQGAIVLPIYPVVGVAVKARLYTGLPETLVHSRKVEELGERLKIQLWENGETSSYGRDHHPKYDLDFMFPGGSLCLIENGVAVPSLWPSEFDGMDVVLGSDITQQLSLTLRHDGTLLVKKRSKRR